MANTGNTQQIIDYGATANDGQGDPLRTAFIKTDENFSNIWAAGPVGSNITIANNTIQNDSTNGNIIIKPNGIGIIQSNAHIVPNSANTRDLGSVDNRWRTVYVGVGGISTITPMVNIPVAFDDLSPTAGARAFVNDGNLAAAGNFGEQIAGGGANTVPVWSDGTNWYIG